MEPARDERGDPGALVVSAAGPDAAMEPARDERGDAPAPGRCGPPSRAAMEPARDERGDCHDLVEAYAGDTPQWSPLAMSGATVTQRYCPGVTLGPQWSPLAMSGATRLTGHAGDRHGAAAMEPARDERGDRAGMTWVAQVESAAM